MPPLPPPLLQPGSSTPSPQRPPSSTCISIPKTRAVSAPNPLSTRHSCRRRSAAPGGWPEAVPPSAPSPLLRLPQLPPLLPPPLPLSPPGRPPGSATTSGHVRATRRWCANATSHGASAGTGRSPAPPPPPPPLPRSPNAPPPSNRTPCSAATCLRAAGAAAAAAASSRAAVASGCPKHRAPHAR
eukprot:156575-Chlamydomonas_euryale.AAC.1